MADYEVARALGYDPCVCGKLDGTWHQECYRGKTDEQIASGYKRAFAVGRRHLARQRAEALRQACGKTPNAAITGAGTAAGA